MIVSPDIVAGVVVCYDATQHAFTYTPINALAQQGVLRKEVALSRLVS
jgi:hypothetical protein